MMLTQAAAAETLARLARYHKQEVVDNTHANVYLVIKRLPAPEDDGPAAKRARLASSPMASAGTAAADVAVDPRQLAKYPAHTFILDSSDYFKTQLNWQSSPRTPATPNASAHAGSSTAALASRPTVHLTIDSAEQLPAAEAVIAAMYFVPNAIAGLEQQQQLVHAIVIADMVHAGAAQQLALQALQAAAQSEQGLSAAAVQAMVGLSVRPSCLLQLLVVIVKHTPCCKNNAAGLAAVTAADDGGSMRQLLVAVFGDLQAVWADEELSTLLLQLQLPAMQLLLSSDQLHVPSEDTVLYTAKRYVRAQTQAADKAMGKAALAPLVRVPQLSVPALSSAALTADSDQQLLGCYVQKLRRLLALKRIAAAADLLKPVKAFGDAPASWQLGARQIRPLEDGVRLEWWLPVEQLSQACRDSFTQQKAVRLKSPGSPPLTGVAWRLSIQCEQKGGGTVVGVFAGPVPGDMPADSYYKIKFTVKAHNV